MAASKKICSLKITLLGTKPPVWRRVEVPQTLYLDELHAIIQAAFGWYDCHLHMFEADGETYAIPSGDPLDDEFLDHDERRVRLKRVAPAPGWRIRYLYDFGDSWDHRIDVERVLDPEPGVAYPRCVTGRRRCPPEDCGGVWGYSRLLEAIADPNHEEREELLEWVGGEFDPADWDLAKVGARLAQITLRA